jgi:hypothetical protein
MESPTQGTHKRGGIGRAVQKSKSVAETAPAAEKTAHSIADAHIRRPRGQQRRPQVHCPAVWICQSVRDGGCA